MKIAHLVTVFPPYKSGISNTAFTEVEGLVKLGHEVTVLTPKYNQEKFSIFDSQFSINYLKPILKYGNAALVPNIVRKLNNFDIIHLHFPFIGATEPVLFAKIRKPLVIQYHMDLTLPKFCSFLIDFYNSIITKNIFKKADKILVSSYDYVENSGLISNFFKKNKEKFIEIPYGVDIEKFRPEEKSKKLLKKYNLSEDDKIILFVGGLDRAHYFKGIDKLLQAVAISNFPAAAPPGRGSGGGKFLVSNAKLLIVGNGNLKEGYKKMAEKLGIKNKVIFTDKVETQELPDYYNLADVFVLPSINRSESFGIVLLEAMACGKLCLASNLPGVRTVIDDGKTGFLVEPRNVEDLAEKIKTSLESRELRKKMGDAGRRKVEEKYNQDKIIKKIEEIYVSLARR